MTFKVINIKLPSINNNCLGTEHIKGGKREVNIEEAG